MSLSVTLQIGIRPQLDMGFQFVFALRNHSSLLSRHRFWAQKCPQRQWALCNTLLWARVRDRGHQLFVTRRYAPLTNYHPKGDRDVCKPSKYFDGSVRRLVISRRYAPLTNYHPKGDRDVCKPRSFFHPIATLASLQPEIGVLVAGTHTIGH